MPLFPIIPSADCRNSKDQLDRNHRTFIYYSRLNNIDKNLWKVDGSTSLLLPIRSLPVAKGFETRRMIFYILWNCIITTKSSHEPNAIQSFSSFKVKLLFLIHRHSMTENHTVVYKKSSIYFLKKHYGHHQRYL